MDLFEKINRSFGSWYEGLFGGGDDVRPKDILRRIIAAMEDHRKEGFDNRVYVPNQYVLEINVHDEEEKQYLLSFLDRDELEVALRRYCQQNHYHIRGALDFTIKEVEDIEAENGKREKVRVRCRYDTKVTAPEAKPEFAPPQLSHAPTAPSAVPMEDRTVASTWGDHDMEDGTVPSVSSAALIVYAPDRPPHRFAIARGSISIGRSPRVGNDLVIESDGQLSKRHARIEMDAEGRFTLCDLGSTNGTKVNGRRVDNRSLNDNDEITLGATRITFQQQSRSESVEREPALAGAALGARSQGTYGGAAARAEDGMGSSSPPSRVLRSRTARLVIMEGEQDVDEVMLGSETLIGRGVTNDVVLPDRSIATRHARLLNDGDGYTLECLSDSALTALNGIRLPAHKPSALKDGDHIGLGDLTLRFVGGS